jgi:malate synthase
VDPGHRPARARRATLEQSLRNVAYALLSGADGWMFDGEDALGQVSTMSLDNQRNLKLALARDPEFLKVAEQVAAEMNRWAQGFLGRRDRRRLAEQLDFTTKIFRARGLHLDDRHVRLADGDGLLRLDRRHGALRHRNNHARSATPAARSCSTCRRSRPPRRPRSGTTC